MAEARHLHHAHPVRIYNSMNFLSYMGNALRADCQNLNLRHNCTSLWTNPSSRP